MQLFTSVNRPLLFILEERSRVTDAIGIVCQQSGGGRSTIISTLHSRIPCLYQHKCSRMFYTRTYLPGASHAEGKKN